MPRHNYESGLDKFNRVSSGANIAFNILFIILALLCVIPVVFVLSISFTSETAIDKYGYALIPQQFSLNAYKYLLKEGSTILRALGISVFVTVIGTLLGVVLTTTMGYVLSRPNFKLKGFLTWVVFIPMIFNGGLVSTYYVTSTLLNLKNSVWVLILPLAVSSFNIIICKTFFRSTIPDSLVESAKIDGASQLKIYLRIVLPISLPLIATIGLFLCFAYWNDWFQSMLYIDDQTLFSLQALLYTMMSNIDYLTQNVQTVGASASQLAAMLPQESVRMAIAIIIVVPVACAYPFFQKYFVTGLTIGAVKG
jgi:ABC-type sugar transport system, permease component